MPTIKQLSRIQSEDTGLNRLQDQLASALNPILREVKGDLSGPLEAPTVAGIQGRAVSPEAPEYRSVLSFDGRQWFPAKACYGSFVSRVDQTIPLVTSSVLAAAAEVTTLANHVSVTGSPANKFTVEYDGVYEVSFSAQLSISGGNKTEIYNWLRIDGTDVVDTTSVIELGNNHGANFPFNTFIISLKAGQYFQFIFAANTVAATPILDATAAVTGSGARPLDPSIIVNIKRIAP